MSALRALVAVVIHSPKTGADDQQVAYDHPRNGPDEDI